MESFFYTVEALLFWRFVRLCNCTGIIQDVICIWTELNWNELIFRLFSNRKRVVLWHHCGMYVSLSCSLWASWQIFIKLSINVYALGAYPKAVLFHFLQSLITAWQTCRILRFKVGYVGKFHHLEKKPVIWEVYLVRIKKNQYRDFWSSQGKPNAWF